MQRFENPDLVLSRDAFKPGRLTWKSPSNIAIIKYWGKYGDQLPQNPSLSFTLSKACSQTTLSYKWKAGSKGTVTFRLDGRINSPFQERVRQYIHKLSEIFPFVEQLDMEIQSENSFPHSAGIASSASGMSALALCLCSLESKLFERADEDQTLLEKASFVARLGSGSACRSVFSTAALWGYDEEVESSSDFYAVTLEDIIHPEFHKFHDSILIVSQLAKSISSSEGHRLMEGNPFAAARYEQARSRLKQIIPALRSGDLDTFGNLAEAEALTLHAMMLCSEPPYILMKPETLEIIERIRAFRASEKVPVYFTMDAGPNVHVLYPDHAAGQVMPFIHAELEPLCEGGKVIHDQVGPGPEQRD